MSRPASQSPGESPGPPESQPRLVLLDGEFVPESAARVSVFDRGFLYGDGVFETIRLARGRWVGWAQHLDRFTRGAALLGIPLSGAPERWRSAADELARRNRLAEGVLRLQLTRGTGTRGYSPRGAERPTWVMTTHPLEPLSEQPLRWRLRTASIRLGTGDPLTAAKTCNRLVNILARAEAEAAGADEALLLNAGGEVVEAASANVFWIEHGTLVTPGIGAGCLPGVTRGLVLELAVERGIRVQELAASVGALEAAEGVFLTLSSCGIVEVAALDGRPLRSSPFIATLQRAYVARAHAAPASQPPA